MLLKWCENILCDPSSASLGQIADFLIYLFDKGLAISTIRSYRSAIASCHKGFQDGSSVLVSSVLSSLCRSFFLKRPPVKSLLPAWSLSSVLGALSKAPFEPLHKSFLHILSIRAASLVAIASGHRVSTLHALSIDPGLFRWEFNDVRLVPRADFIAKNLSPASQSVEILLSSISSFSSAEEGLVWCPVRALYWYLDRTKSKRSSTSCLSHPLSLLGLCPRLLSLDGSSSASLWPDLRLSLFLGRVRAHNTNRLVLLGLCSVAPLWRIFSRLLIGLLPTLSFLVTWKMS